MIMHRNYSAVKQGTNILIDKTLKLLTNVIQLDEERDLLNYTNTLLVRKRYEGTHWDDVIQQYKEIELTSTKYHVPNNIQNIINRIQSIIRNTLSDNNIQYLPTHIIELAANGFINDHIDSIKFSGGIVAGLSLDTTRILKLTLHNEINNNSSNSNIDISNKEASFDSNNEFLSNEDQKSLLNKGYIINERGIIYDKTFSSSNNNLHNCLHNVELELLPRSVYILTNKWRYNYNHSILKSNNKRTSLIFRDMKSVDVPDYTEYKL